MYLLRIYFALTSVTLLLSVCGAYRILGVFPFSAKSHNIVLEALMKGLAKRGHQVDVVTHFQQKKPVKNYNDIISLEGTMESLMNNYTIEFVKQLNDDMVTLISETYGNRLCHLMGLEKMQNLIKNPPKDPPYDVVIVEAFCANCFMGLGYVFKVPVIAVSTAVEYPWVSHFIGNDDNPAYVSNAFHIGMGKLNFWERLKNMYTNFIELHKFHTFTEKSQTDSMRKYLDPNIPSIREVEKNVALTLVNSHPVLFGVKPLTPTLVQIGGLHIEINDEKLSPELQKWMDESTNGVIYFTLGSMVLIESMPVEQLQEIYASFKKLTPVRVLMKIVDKLKLPPGLPENVKVLPWTPQIPILAHRNTKIFITHGGLGGLQEALYYGVPMIGLPLFSDQFRNVESFVVKDMLIRIDFDKFSGQRLDSALQALLHNPIYKEKAAYYSKIFRDQPLSPLNGAIFWTEYIIRNGADVMRSPALDLYWWQLAMLDVYGFIVSIAVLALMALILIIKKLFKISRRVSQNGFSKKKKSQ